MLPSALPSVLLALVVAKRSVIVEDPIVSCFLLLSPYRIACGAVQLPRLLSMQPSCQNWPPRHRSRRSDPRDYVSQGSSQRSGTFLVYRTVLLRKRPKFYQYRHDGARGCPQLVRLLSNWAFASIAARCSSILVPDLPFSISAALKTLSILFNGRILPFQMTSRSQLTKTPAP